MTSRQLWITCRILFLFFVLASTPAKIVVSFLQTPEELQLNGVDGTVWLGSVQNIHYKGIDLGLGNWVISPWSLLLLSIDSEIHTQNELSKIDAELVFSLSGVSSDSVKARFPAKWIPKLTGAPFKSEGKVLLRLIDFEQSSDAPIKITGSVAWQEASIQTAFSSSRAQLGNLQVDISSKDETLFLDLRDNQGPLGLKANIEFNPPNKIIVKGSVNENLPTDLANFFQFFSKPDNKGKRIINYSGIIPGL